MVTVRFENATATFYQPTWRRWYNEDERRRMNDACYLYTGPNMNSSEKNLVILMRVAGVLLVTAVIPAVMPFAWMKDVHRTLGMGDLPEAPITGYLTRSLSAMYAMHGALVFFLSLDVRRYLPVVKFLAVLGVFFGCGMLVLDIVVGMPPRWIAGEGPFIIVLGGVMFWLAGRVQSAEA